jgi:hypothetical protein
MKKLFLISIIILSVVACKKTKFSPEGPTDVRIKNLSDQIFSEVIITTSEYTEDTDTLKTVDKYATSEYIRFKKAYPKAEITANINGQVYTTGTVSFNSGLTYIGQAKITFEVWISDNNKRKLELRVVYPLDGPLD